MAFQTEPDRSLMDKENPLAERPRPMPKPALPIMAEVIPGLIWGFRFDSGGAAEAIADTADLAGNPDGWTWLHFNLTDMRAKGWLAASPIVPKTGLELFRSGDNTQRLSAGDDCLLGIFFDLVHGFDRGNDDFGHLRFVMTERVLITGRRRALNSVEAIRQAIEQGRRFPTATDLVKAIIDELAAGIERIARELATEADAIEDSILGDLGLDERQRLGRVRMTTVSIHRRLNGLRTLFRRFNADGGLAESLHSSVGQLLLRLDEIDHEVVEVRDRARLMQEEITVKLAEQTNRHLHVLSILTALLLPPALIAGLFGMNLSGMPFTATSGGFWWAVGLTLVVSVAALLAMRWMGVFRR
ncbi:MAG: CorA family divalent cation transporter [Bauldia sp.]